MSAPGLPALLHLPGWRDGVRHVAGPLDGPAPTSVVLADGAGATVVPDAGPGTLLCLTGSVGIAAADAWRLEAQLRRAADAGVVAVLLPATAQPSGATRLLCSRLGVALLLADEPVLQRALEAAVVLAAPDVERARATRAVSAAVAAGSGVDGRGLVRLLGRLLDVPVALLDGRGAVLHAGSVAVPAAGLRTGEPVPQRVPVAAAEGGGTLVAHPVLLPGVRAAQRWFAGAAPAWADVDAVADCLAVAAAGLAGRLGVDRLGLERDARARAALLTDVLAAGEGPDAELRRRAAGAGWALDGWHVGVRIGTPATTDTAGSRDEVAAVFADGGLAPVVVEHGDGWSAWITLPRPPGAETVRALAEDLRQVHRTLRRHLRCWTGVGRPHAGPGGVARSLAEATDAAGLAAGRTEQGCFLHVDQLGVAQTLLAWTRTGTFPPAARSLLEPLGPPESDLVTTLTAYLDQESSLVQTAAVLGVHRNTVAARIARVQQLLEVDLTDRDQRLALHLACRAVAG
ncbi:helix-turn-helix domain-containing protein [Kineococcus sp. NPDC059986]|uniref:PucR family transcriptional regulator n=1 Tax=Kineococcus sp. NPDC059986 TaxID=3155538 RepID=UPI00344DCD5F